MIRIMFVDDEKAIRDNLSSLVSLEDEGFLIVGTAMNGLDALQKLPKLKPNVIFLDVAMPVMDGLTFLKELKKSSFAKTEIVILSGYNEFEYAKMAMRYGARAYLSKPVDEDEMVAILREIKESRNAARKEGAQEERLIQKTEEIKRLYRGGSMVTDQFRGYFLLHTILLSELNKVDRSSVQVRDEGMDQPENPEKPENSAKSLILDSSSYALIRSKGCVSSYLVEQQVTEPYQHNYAAYASGMILRLRALGKQCAILIDPILSFTEGEAFRRTYDSHLYDMLTEIFYHQELSFFLQPLHNNHHQATSSDCEERCFTKIKQGLQSLDWNLMEFSLEQLFHETEQKKIAIEYIQEIGFRLFYLVRDLYPDITCKKTDFWELPYFYRFPQWKKKLMEWLLQVYLECKETVKQKSMGSKGEAVAWVKLHYKEPITLKQAADHFFLNPAYMGRLFQKVTGVNFNQYVNDLRIEEAKRLLIQSDKMIYEIAEEIGYTESKYFISKFTEKIGLSPSEYRKRKAIHL